MGLILRQDVVAAPFDDGGVLHDARTGRLFVVNAWAAAMLNALRAGADDRLIVDHVARGAGVDPVTVRQDLSTFVSGLRAADLLSSGDARHEPETGARPPPDDGAALDAAYRIGERIVRVVCHPEGVARAFGAVAAPSLFRGVAPADARLTLFREDDGFVVLEDDRIVDRVSSARSARWALVRELVGEGRGRPWLALLHASVALGPDGCILLCGASGAGKSTLLAGLIHAGFPFVADDIALLERGTGLIWPTPLAISVKDSGWPLVGRMFPGLAEQPVVRFGERTMRYLHPEPSAIAAEAGHPIAAVLFVRHAHQAATVLDRLDPKAALERLGEGGSILPDSDAGLDDFLRLWQALPAFELTYGDLDDAVRRIRGLTACGQGLGATASASL